MDEMLRAKVVAILHAAAAAQDLPIRFDEDAPDRDAHDYAIVTARVPGKTPAIAVTVSRPATSDEAPGRTTRRIETAHGKIGAQHVRRLQAFVSEHARLLRRDEVIRPYVRSGMAPVWSYVMHRAARLLVTHACEGRFTIKPSLDNVVRPKPGLGGRGGHWRELSTGRVVTFTLPSFTTGYGHGVGEARGDRVFVNDLEIGRRADGGMQAIFKDTLKPQMFIVGQTMTETVLAACPGLDLAQVVGHDAFGDRCGVTVTRAEADRGGILLYLSTVLDPAGDTPEGVDVSWRSA